MKKENSAHSFTDNTCRQCNGTGKIFLRPNQQTQYIDCDMCEGTGQHKLNTLWTVQGQKINQWRIEHSMTLRECSRRYKIDASNLSKMERGIIKPNVELVRISCQNSAHSFTEGHQLSEDENQIFCRAVFYEEKKPFLTKDDIELLEQMARLFLFSELTLDLKDQSDPLQSIKVNSLLIKIKSANDRIAELEKRLAEAEKERDEEMEDFAAWLLQLDEVLIKRPKKFPPVDVLVDLFRKEVKEL